MSMQACHIGPQNVKWSFCPMRVENELVLQIWGSQKNLMTHNLYAEFRYLHLGALVFRLVAIIKG